MIEPITLTVDQLGEVSGAGLPRLDPKLVKHLQAMMDKRAFPPLPELVEPLERRIFPGISRLQ